MPRGGARKGAGRPRGFSKKAKALNEVFYESKHVAWGWHDDRLVTQVAKGEYAHWLRSRLVSRLAMQEASKALVNAPDYREELMRSVAGSLSLTSIAVLH